jgi:hypothetical protein
MCRRCQPNEERPALFELAKWSQGESNRGLEEGQGSTEVLENAKKTAESGAEEEREARPDLALNNTKEGAKTGPGPEAKV